MVALKLPISVILHQPPSVSKDVYRIRMGSKSKKQLQEAVLAHLELRGGPLRSNESGVTRLKALGLSNGSAQRVLDDDSDVRLETLEQLAAGLKVQLWELLMPVKDITPARYQISADTPLSEANRLLGIDGGAADQSRKLFSPELTDTLLGGGPALLTMAENLLRQQLGMAPLPRSAEHASWQIDPQKTAA